jgi:hypothetical protein
LGVVLDVLSSASNFTFVNNEVDGNNIGVTVQQGYTLGFVNSGTLTIQYNYLHDSGGDMVEIQDGTWTNQQIRYNLFSNIGLQTDHSDTIQWCGSDIAAGNMDFNTMHQPNSGLSGEGLLTLNSECGPSVISATSNIRNVTVRGNTGLSLSTTPQPGTGNQDNFAFGQTITQDAGTALGDHNATIRNYVDPTGIMAYTGSPWFPTSGYNTSSGAAVGTPGAMHTLIDMRNGTSIPVPTASAKQGGWYTYPDETGYSPSLSDIFSITPSPTSGNITTGSSVTFTLVFDTPQTVTGTPTLTLNDGGTASYTSGTGTKSLVFTHTVAAGNSATTLGVTAVNGTLSDDVGFATKVSPLTNLTTSFAGLSVNSGAASISLFSVPSTAVTSSSAAFSFNYTGSAPTGMTCVWNSGAVAGGTVTGFSASGGSGSGSCPTPAVAGTKTLTATGTGPNTASGAAGNATVISAPGACPDSDGATGASAGVPQFPSLLSGYTATINGAGGLGCQVAGVDYHVGLPSGASLVVPTSGNLPAGASISGNVVTIGSNNVTFQGFDMTGKGLQASGVSGTIIQNNKFQVTSTCQEPILFMGGGSMTVQYNNIDGGGSTCNSAGFVNSRNGELNAEGVSAGAVITYQYNYHTNSWSDNLDISGPGSGTATIHNRFNLYYGAGYGSPAGAHPDGIQFCGGNFANSDTVHNTFVLPQSQLSVGADTQMFHYEAQCSPAGQITNGVVAYNTTVQPGSAMCHGVDEPGTCTSNSTISCKNDNPPSTVNSGFKAYGNYMDWTTSQIGLDDSSGCTSTTWNSPQPNKDMKTGATMVINAGHF